MHHEDAQYSISSGLAYKNACDEERLSLDLHMRVVAERKLPALPSTLL
jgi:hypothetical protein